MRRPTATQGRARRRAAVAFPWRSLAADATMLVGLLAILAALLLYAAARPPTRTAFTVDRPPADNTLRFFYPVERTAELTYRWTEPRATIQLPVAAPGTYRVTLALLDAAARPPRSATIAVEGRTLTTVALDGALRDVVVDAEITPQAWKDDSQHDLDVTIETPPSRVDGDLRPLGVVIARIGIEPQAIHRPWQPTLLLTNLILLIASYGVLRSCGLSLRWAAGVCGAMIAAYAGFAALARGEALALGYTLALAPVRPLVALALLAGLLGGSRLWLRRMAPGTRALLARGALVTALYSVATVAMTWPLALQMNTATATAADPPLQLWIARWVQHALVTDPRHLYDANVFHPYANTLAYSDANIPMALLHWPFFLLAGDDLVAFNLLMLGTFVLAAVGMYALTWRLTRNRGAAFLAGLAFAFLPARFAHLPHLHQLSQAWTPWVALALLMLIARQQWRWSIILGLALALEALCSFYLAAQLLCVVVVVVLVALIADRRARSWRCLSRLALAGAVALALVVPFAWPYLTVNSELGLERRIEESAQSGRIATLDSYRKVMAPDPPWGGLLPPAEEGNEDVLYPGGVVLIGALAGIVAWRRRRLAITFLLLGLLAFVLSLGPTLPLPGGRSIPLPYAALYSGVPLFKALRVPARFGMLADFALVVLAAGGAAACWRWLARRTGQLRRPALAAVVTALLAIAILAELRVLPVPLDPVDRSPETIAPYRWLAEQDDGGAVLDLPIFLARYSRAMLMYWSTHHWHPLIEGYSGFVPPGYWERLAPFTRDLPRPDGTTSRAVGYIDEATIGLVRDLGVRYILYHRGDYRAVDWPLVLAAIEQTGAVDRVAEFDAMVIYRLR